MIPQKYKYFYHAVTAIVDLNHKRQSPLILYKAPKREENDLGKS